MCFISFATKAPVNNVDPSNAAVFNLPKNQLNHQQVYQGQANLQGFHQVLGQSQLQVKVRDNLIEKKHFKN